MYLLRVIGLLEFKLEGGWEESLSIVDLYGRISWPRCII